MLIDFIVFFWSFIASLSLSGNVLAYIQVGGQSFDTATILNMGIHIYRESALVDMAATTSIGKRPVFGTNSCGYGDIYYQTLAQWSSWNILQAPSLQHWQY